MNRLSDAQIDDLLRHDFDAVTDDDFSKRVMQSLPQRPANRAWIMPVACSAGALFAWASLSRAPIWQIALDQWLSGNAGAAILIASASGLVAGVLALGWAVEQAN